LCVLFAAFSLPQLCVFVGGLRTQEIKTVVHRVRREDFQFPDCLRIWKSSPRIISLRRPDEREAGGELRKTEREYFMKMCWPLSSSRRLFNGLFSCGFQRGGFLKPGHSSVSYNNVTSFTELHPPTHWELFDQLTNNRIWVEFFGGKTTKKEPKTHLKLFVCFSTLCRTRITQIVYFYIYFTV